MKLNISLRKIAGIFAFLVIAVLALSFFSSAVSAAAKQVNNTENFAVAEQIVNARVSCSQLNESQMAMIGDYFMEQIHSGKQHEYMDAMMGGEGSQSLEYMHIAMAEQFYCNNPQYFPEAAGSRNSGSYQQGYGMMGGYNGASRQYAQPGSNGAGFMMVSGLYTVSTILSLLLIIIVVVLILVVLRKK